MFVTSSTAQTTKIKNLKLQINYYMLSIVLLCPDLLIRIGDTNIAILLYADDIALVAENETNLQKMFDFVNEWCETWKLSINSAKTQIVHFRKSRKKLTQKKFFYWYKRN